MNLLNRHQLLIKLLVIPVLGFLVIVISGCGTSDKNYVEETMKSGTIYISVDESFRPIIDSEIKVFIAQNPEAHIIARYKPEAECIKDLLYDSIRMVIVTRGLSEEEVKFFSDTLGYAPIYGKIASDAIAVLVNNNANDSLFSVSEIKGMLSGSNGFHYKLVMDGNKATSTVRFMIDSVLKGQPFSANVQAAATSEGVIDYVAKNVDAIGFVGVSWIGNPEDTTQLSFLDKVKIANLQCRGCEEEVYVKPYQANIVLNRYPMVRGLYYILKENYAGLGKGFTSFLNNQKGQLIFKRAYLAPAKMALQVRHVDVEEIEY